MPASECCLRERVCGMPKLPVSQDQYRIIFERSPVAIRVADSNERITSFNVFAERLLGMDEVELLGKDVASLYPSEEWQRIRALNIRAIGHRDHFETKRLRKDASVVDVDLSVTVIKDDAGKLLESIAIIHDITQRKITEREVLAAARSKGEFLAMVSHELRTPLTAVKGSLGIMLEGATGEFNEEQKDFLVTAQRNAERLELLISNVLDYQRLEAGTYEFKLTSGNANDIVDMVRADMELAVQKKKLALIITKADSLPQVSMDQERLRRAVRNLVDNAIKFTEKGQVAISTALELNQVAIHVKDTGIGIKPEDKDKLFERFSQISSGHGRQTGSLGLGLVIARKIVSAHHGDIWIQSKLGEGSQFSIYLPVLKESK